MTRFHPGLNRIGQFGWRDLTALLLVLGLILLLGSAARQMGGQFVTGQEISISLSPAMLPGYVLRTVVRMLAGLVASLIFTFIYATIAAKSRRAEMVLIPLLDVLQSVPILGYLSFTVLFFISLFPGSILGPECAAIFAIFTSQAWNMAFSFYQSLRMIPTDLDDANRSMRACAWQRFWLLEVPFAMPGLVWNMMMSMSGGWFFVVAAEAISVGRTQITLPGIGSYIALAIRQQSLTAVGWAIIAMSAAILLYDQLLFRPLVTWAEKFRFEETASQINARSWLVALFRRSSLIRSVGIPVGEFCHAIFHARLGCAFQAPRPSRSILSERALNAIWLLLVAAAIVFIAGRIAAFVRPSLSWADGRTALKAGGLTLLRVAVLIVLASLVWVPAGVAIGLRPNWTERFQPVIQFLAAFPANLLFPVAIFLIVRFRLSPVIWLSPLMILGTQWYILFNVIAGASAFPTDLREAAMTFRVRRWRWWRDVILPGIFPYYVTGAITASGGAWNASIVSEAVRWGPKTIDGSGLGAYIARMTDAGDYPRIALGIAVMSVLVIVMNRLLWRPLYTLAERQTRLD